MAFRSRLIKHPYAEQIESAPLGGQLLLLGHLHGNPGPLPLNEFP